jgi:hypothetical protein
MPPTCEYTCSSTREVMLCTIGIVESTDTLGLA